MAENPRPPDLLTAAPVPELSLLQLSVFNRESLTARPTLRLDPSAVAGRLLASQGAETRVIDIGGTAMKYNRAVVGEGGAIHIDPLEETVIPAGETQGLSYLQGLRTVAEASAGAPVGISTAGVVEEGELVDSPNLPAFTRELVGQGGFRGILGPRVAVMNDAEAGAVAGAVGVYLKSGVVRPTIYIINGGGLGGAAVDETGQVIAMEPGHIPVADPALNPNGVTQRCGLLGRDFVCLERIAASGAGIEAQWQRLTGEKLQGRDIATLMYAGDKRALALYENSARIFAHAIEGIRTSFGFPIEGTAVVLHGGGFRAPGMVERMQQILDKHYLDAYQVRDSVELIPTGSLGMNNACMSGLAMAALMQ